MAIIKHRIMSRGRVTAILTDRFNDDLRNPASSDERKQAERDMFFYMIADDKEVKIYNDVDMGGKVVEYDDGIY